MLDWVAMPAVRAIVGKRVPRAFKPWQMLISSIWVCFHDPEPTLCLQIVHVPMTTATSQANPPNRRAQHCFQSM